MERKIRDHITYLNELIGILKSEMPKEKLIAILDDYHEKDIAEALEFLTQQERINLYHILGLERVSEVFSYLSDSGKYMSELPLENAAAIIQELDADDAVEILGELDNETRDKILNAIDIDSKEDIRLICSYGEDEIGSKMTTNFIVISRHLTIKQAMRALIAQAEENDNISILYVSDDDGTYYGAIDLKDLIIARENEDLETLITRSYPYVGAHEEIDDCIESLKEYDEDSIPVLNDKLHLIGVITARNIVDVVDDEMGEDYAKFAGLTAEEDLHETLFTSMKKRMPWLIALLFLGMVVSTVVGMFENVVSHIALIVCFQSLILDMAGNVGTQSLAVTIRVLMDENLHGKQKAFLVFKEMRVGFCNGLILGILSFVFVGLYIHLFKNMPLSYAFSISFCVGLSLLVAMVISSFVGTIVPMFFHKIKVDPAVASGPLITTVNDLVAVVAYYGLAWLLIIDIMHLV